MQTPSEWLTKYLRLNNYLGAAQLYLKDNFLLEEELKPQHIKKRVVGHWGTVPGLNFIWACLNYAITQHNQKVLTVVGPGHGYPAVQSNLFIEGSLGEFYSEYSLNNSDVNKRKEAFGKLIKNFSWAGGFPSHSNPYTPGCILEGGELGYSLSTAYGAAFDNPDLVVACIVGDGEAETGPTATAWHSNKFLNPVTSGAVLPILHLNGYKISGPTILSSMSNEDLIHLFTGYGYHPIIVEGNMLFEPMIAATMASFDSIKAIQKDARENGKTQMPRWPMIILRSEKGWFGPDAVDNQKPIVDSFRSHGVPLEHVLENPKEFEVLKKWLESYNIRELVTDDYSIKPEVVEYVPEGELRMGMNRNSRAADTKDLNIPEVKDYAQNFKKRGGEMNISTDKLSEYMRDIFKLNAKEANFRVFCPDESVSNRLHKLFEVTGRTYLLPTKWHDENMAPDGRLMEMLSEHTLEGWFQGYTLTGRHGLFASYEAFMEIISSMVDQYAKFLRHSREIKWRKPVPSLNFLVTSLSWRQDHNGFSHQNPGFISSMLNNHGDFISIYFPTDSNSMLHVAEEVFKSKNKINLIVADKRPVPQWLDFEQARKQIKEDVQIWPFVSDENPDVVMVGCGDHPMREVIAARHLLKQMAPGIKIRIINITELTNFGIGDTKASTNVSDVKFDEVFTTNKPIIFNYHGYPEDIKSLIFGHHAAQRFSIHGYNESGTTTTPFDMLVRNKVDRYSLALEAANFAAANNVEVAAKLDEIETKIQTILKKHQEYILKTNEDLPEVDSFDFSINT